MKKSTLLSLLTLAAAATAASLPVTAMAGNFPHGERMEISREHKGTSHFRPVHGDGRIYRERERNRREVVRYRHDHGHHNGHKHAKHYGYRPVERHVVRRVERYDYRPVERHVERYDYRPVEIRTPSHNPDVRLSISYDLHL